jgi:hypothetical protein
VDEEKQADPKLNLLAEVDQRTRAAVVVPHGVEDALATNACARFAKCCGSGAHASDRLHTRHRYAVVACEGESIQGKELADFAECLMRMPA